jgi:hypothetical protein
MSEEGARRIMRERRRQIQQEGWSEDHDDKLAEDQLAWAAVCYAAPERVYTLLKGVTPEDPVISFNDPWPQSLDPTFDKRPSFKRKPSLRTRVRALEKAGALIAAEIDRLLRIKEAEESEETTEAIS